jgi:hypothetical protein
MFVLEEWVILISVSDISFSVDIGFLVHLLQLERGTTALYISSGGSDIVFNFSGIYMFVLEEWVILISVSCISLSLLSIVFWY